VIDEIAILELFAVPGSRGEYWPVAVGGFHMRAIDDAGVEHVPAGTAFMLGSVLWPPLGTEVRRLRVEVSTLWEAAWVDLELPEQEGRGTTAKS